MATVMLYMNNTMVDLSESFQVLRYIGMFLLIHRWGRIQTVIQSGTVSYVPHLL